MAFSLSTVLRMRWLPGTPAAPPANASSLYFKSDGLPYCLNPSGVEQPLIDTTGGGGTTLPVGAMMMWPLAAPPAGWLICDGTAIPAGNTSLIALIGANTPDLRSRFPVGAGSLAAVGGNEGLAEAARVGRMDHRHTHTVTINAEASHTHVTGAHSHTIPGQAAGTATTAATGGQVNVTSRGSFDGHAHGGDTGQGGGLSNTGTGTSHSHGGSTATGSLSDGANAYHPHLGVNFIIKT